MECGVPEANAHGSRHSVVECESPHGRDLADGVADAARHPTALERIPASATQGKVERFQRFAAARANYGAACPTSNASSGWMSIATNITVRPHEALEMQTPASRWRRSARAYNPHPAPWQYRRRDGGEGQHVGPDLDGTPAAEYQLCLSRTAGRNGAGCRIECWCTTAVP